VENTMRK